MKGADTSLHGVLRLWFPGAANAAFEPNSTVRTTLKKANAE